MITHQMEVIKQVCDRVAVLEAGQVVETGRVIDVFLRPQHAVTRAMIGDVIAQELPASVLKRVESRLGNGRDHVYRLAFTGENVDRPVLAQAIRQHGLDFNILHGHIDEIQGQAFGSLAIMATGEPAAVRAAMEYLQTQGVVVEEIEHVV
ncbi:Methionine import ATP-binding protein MetN [compost metagenome]